MASTSEAVINLVGESVRATFGTICGAEPVQEPNPKRSGPYTGLVGMISFAGDTAWWLALVLPDWTSVEIGRKFGGASIPFKSPLMDDMVRELANVLGGDVVARMEAIGLRARMSLPTVERGDDVDALLPKVKTTMEQLTFSSPQGKFWVYLANTPSGIQLGREPGT